MKLDCHSHLPGEEAQTPHQGGHSLCCLGWAIASALGVIRMGHKQFGQVFKEE